MNKWIREWAWRRATRGVEVGQRWALDLPTANPFARARGPQCVATVRSVHEGWIQYMEHVSGRLHELDGDTFRRLYYRIDQ